MMLNLLWSWAERSVRYACHPVCVCVEVGLLQHANTYMYVYIGVFVCVRVMCMYTSYRFKKTAVGTLTGRIFGTEL